MADVLSVWWVVDGAGRRIKLTSGRLNFNFTAPYTPGNATVRLLAGSLPVSGSEIISNGGAVIDGHGPGRALLFNTTNDVALAATSARFEFVTSRGFEYAASSSSASTPPVGTVIMSVCYAAGTTVSTPQLVLDLPASCNQCFSQPCQNGGSCISQLFGYLCRCIAGYAGPNCQTDINVRFGWFVLVNTNTGRYSFPNSVSGLIGDWGLELGDWVFAVRYRNVRRMHVRMVARVAIISIHSVVTVQPGSRVDCVRLIWMNVCHNRVRRMVARVSMVIMDSNACASLDTGK